MVADRVKVATTYPMPPAGRHGLVGAVTRLAAPLPEADRVSAGFPGMVRRGVVLSAPHFVTENGPGTAVDPGLVAAWSRFPLAEALAEALGKPTRVANDADIQGAAVVAGLGLEIAHLLFRKGETYDEQLGERTRKTIGDVRWNNRVRKALHALDALVFYDHLYIGGGNGRRVVRDDLGELLARTTVIDNAAGILGGIRLWDDQHLAV